MTDKEHSSGSEQRGMDGLTEVLRLQAEALSRISERMAESKGLQTERPPVTPPSFRGSGHEAGNFPVRVADPSLDEESLPVLNSFKKFLDQERHRARKRMLWVLLGFSVVVAGALIVVVWMSSERSKALEGDLVQTQAKAEQARIDAGLEIKRLGEKTALIATQNVTQIRKDLARNMLWAHSVLASNLNSELSGRDGDIDRVKDKLSTLEIENALVSRKVADLEQRIKDLEEALKDRAEIAALETQIRDQDASVVTNRFATGGGTTPVMINSAKYGRAFQLRMPQE